MKDFTKQDLFWIRQPKEARITETGIEIITEPGTDLWQRTYYGFQNDNAPVLQTKTAEQYFSFVVKTDFESKHRFDQCGIVMYLDSENWLKGSIEYENDSYQRLGSVVTNHGYSDWATTDIDCIECSEDGVNFKQMRICHLLDGAGEISFGIYACSPENSSFKATFSHMQITECMWKEHK